REQAAESAALFLLVELHRLGVLDSGNQVERLAAHTQTAQQVARRVIGDACLRRSGRARGNLHRRTGALRAEAAAPSDELAEAAAASGDVARSRGHRR